MNYLIDTQKYCIVTPDCFGHQYYLKNNDQYNTPFVSLLIHLDCYIKLLENFNNFNDSSEIVKLDTTKYLTYVTPRNSKYSINPIETIFQPNYILFGLKINNNLIEIHNIHDNDYNKTIFKFKRILKRLNKKKCIFILNDMNIKDIKCKSFDDILQNNFIESNSDNKIISKNIFAIYNKDKETFYKKFSNNLILTKPYSYYVKKFINLKLKNKVIFCKHENKDESILNISKEHKIIYYPNEINSAPCLWNYIKNNNINILSK